MGGKAHHVYPAHERQCLIPSDAKILPLSLKVLRRKYGESFAPARCAGGHFYSRRSSATTTGISAVTSGRLRITDRPFWQWKKHTFKNYGFPHYARFRATLLQNHDITTLDAEAYRQQVSYCFQTPQLFGQTVYDNLALPWQIRRQKPHRERLVAHLESVNLSPDMLNKSVEQLSGGEKQRIGLLRNLQFMPDILLLDEVTSALDDVNRLAVLSLINRISVEDKVAVVRISHDVNDIEQAGNVLRLATPEEEHQREST